MDAHRAEGCATDRHATEGRAGSRPGSQRVQATAQNDVDGHMEASVSTPVREEDAVSPEMFVDGLSREITGEMNVLYGRLIAPNGLWDFALDLAFHEDPRVAFRGSWALEWAYYNDHEAFRPYIKHFLANFLKAANPSVHRHYTKMLWDMQRRGMLTLDDKEAEEVAAKAFELLIDPATKVAVIVWCMEILYDLSPRLGWVEEQLYGVVRRIMEDDPSRGVANRGAKLLRRMDKRMES